MERHEEFFELPDRGWGSEKLQRELESLKVQVKNLEVEAKDTKDQITQRVNELNAQVFQNVAPVVNYINNGDFVFEQEDYEPGSNYANDHLDLAHWYKRDSTSTGLVTEHTTTVQSGDAITSNTTGIMYWQKANGEVAFGGRNALMAPLPKNVAFPASSLFCRFQVKKRTSGVSIPNTWRFRASIWDNTSGQQKIITGASFELTLNAAFPSPGAFTRKYILRVDTGMDFFYSKVAPTVVQTNQVSVSNIDNVNFVTVSWPVFPEASKYTLYRHETEFNEWREIASIVNGATSFKDVGGRTGALFIPPVADVLPRAHALFVNFGVYVTVDYQDVIFNITIPSNYNYALTTGKQWLRIDMLDENLDFVTVENEGLLIDKVALGYTNGRFCYSSRDLQTTAAIAATTPPPTPPPGGSDGSGGGIPPLPGEGDEPRPLETLLLV